MDFARKISRFCDAISEWTGRIFGWIIVPLVLLTVMEVTLRRFFGAPTIWSFEVLKQLYALHFMIVAGFGLLYGSHVSVDVFTMVLKEKTKAILDLISYVIFFFPFMLVCLAGLTLRVAVVGDEGNHVERLRPARLSHQNGHYHNLHTPSHTGDIGSD